MSAPRPVLAGEYQPLRALRAGAERGAQYGPDVPLVRNSQFLVTCNTNYRPRTDAEAQRLGDDLMQAFGCMWTSGAGRAWHSILKFRPYGNCNGVGRPDLVRMLDDPDVTYRAEIGPVTGFLHLHAVISINHRVPKPGLHLNASAIKKLVRECGKYPQIKRLPYVNIQGGSNREALLRYISKQASGADGSTARALLNDHTV